MDNSDMAMVRDFLCNLLAGFEEAAGRHPIATTAIIVACATTMTLQSIALLAEKLGKPKAKTVVDAEPPIRLRKRD